MTRPKSKVVLALEAKISALEAQLEVGRVMYKALRDSHPAQHRDHATATVTYWRDAHGQLWAKQRLGNRATSRLVAENSAINSGAHA